MTLPKGFGPGGYTGGGRRDDIEKMIGRRVENFKGILALGFALCWAATAGGVYVGVTSSNCNRGFRLLLHVENMHGKTNPRLETFLFLFYVILYLGIYFSVSV